MPAGMIGPVSAWPKPSASSAMATWTGLDVAIATGGQIVGDERGNTLDNLRPEMLGRASRVLITHDTTTIERGGGDPARIELRRRELRAAIAREVYLSYDREQLQKRLARLAGGIALIKVGGATDTEIQERKERVRGAASAVRAAVADGILPGGGAALVHASKAIAARSGGDLAQRAAIGAVRRALLAPAHQIAANAGPDGSVVVARLLECDDPAFGFDAAAGRYGNLIETGVIDAARVVCTALRIRGTRGARIRHTHRRQTREDFHDAHKGIPPSHRRGHRDRRPGGRRRAAL